MINFSTRSSSMSETSSSSLSPPRGLDSFFAEEDERERGGMAGTLGC
jgi:hypothetical protein